MKTLFRLSILMIIALNLAGTIFGVSNDYLLFFAAIGALVGGFPLMGRGFQKAAVIFFVLGAGMLLFGHHPFQVWVKAATSMTNIIAIVAVMQTFAIPIKVGAYDEAIKSWMDGRLKGKSSLFIFLTLTTHLLTSFLNMGSVPVTVSLFEPTLKARVPDWKRFFARAATRGYVLSVLWSPGAVNLSLVAQATGLSWSQVFIPGFILAFLGMGASWFSEFLGSRGGNALLPQPDGHNDRLEGGRAAHVLGIVAVFIVLVAALERLKIGASAGRTVLAGLVLALVWTLSQARRPGMKTAIKTHWREGLLKVGDIAPFFVAMGIFSTALEASGLLEAAAPFSQGRGGLSWIGVGNPDRRHYCRRLAGRAPPLYNNRTLWQGAFLRQPPNLPHHNRPGALRGRRRGLHDNPLRGDDHDHVQAYRCKGCRYHPALELAL